MDLSRPEVLAALAVAPLLWWLSRPPRPRRLVDTSHLPQWRAALARLRRREVRFRKLRFWLLLVAFVAVVLAGSGPRSAAEAGPRVLAVLLDGSPSMGAREPGGETAYDLARNRLVRGISSVPSDVQVRVLTTDPRGTLQIIQGTPDEIVALLVDLAPVERGVGLDLASVAASLDAPDIAVWTLTDGRGALRIPEHGALDVVGDPGLVNRAITALRVDDRWPLAEIHVELEVRAFPPTSEFPGLTIEGGVEAEPPVVRPEAVGRWRVQLLATRRQGGTVQVALGSAGTDAQPADDRVVFRVAEAPAPVVGVLRAAAADDADWVGRTAAVLAELGGGQVVDARPGQAVDLLLVDGGRLEGATARSWTFGTAFAVGTDRVAPTVAGWDRRHPLTRGLDLSELVVRRGVAAEALPAGVPLVQALDGPLVVAVERDGDRSLHLAFRLEDSNLPLLAAFPQLVRRTYVWIEGESLTPRDDPTLDAAEADLRRAGSAASRPLPGFGRDGTGLAVPLLLLALVLLALRAYAR